MHLKLLQKAAEATGDFIGVQQLIKLQKFKEIHNRIAQRQLQMKQKILDLIEKYLKKDIHLQKKDRKLLMI